MNNQDVWVDLKTIAEIKDITPRALRIALGKDKYTFREVLTQGGKSYEILLASLEPHVQKIYKNTYYREIIETIKNDSLLPIEKPVKTESGFVPEQAKTVALARVDLLEEWLKFRNEQKPRQKRDKLFLDLYNSGEYLKNIFQIIGKTSRGTLLRWHKIYKDYENWESLVPGYNYTSFNEYRTSLTEEEIGIFLKLLLHPNQFSIGKATKLTIHNSNKKISYI